MCGRHNILTRNCSCRRHVLVNLPVKNVCEPLRLHGAPLKLIFDITITTDIFTVIVNPIQPQSRVNGILVQYLSILKRFPKMDNTIDVDFKLQGIRHSMNCVIDYSMEAPMSIGLLSLLHIGMQFSLGNSIINSNSIAPTNPSAIPYIQPLNSDPPAPRNNLPSPSYLNNRSFARSKKASSRLDLKIKELAEEICVTKKKFM